MKAKVNQIEECGNTLRRALTFGIGEYIPGAEITTSETETIEDMEILGQRFAGMSVLEVAEVVQKCHQRKLPNGQYTQTLGSQYQMMSNLLK